jgi:hypothetical protein
MAETPETLEGRLIAHRRILARLVQAVASGESGPALLDDLDDRRRLDLHAEDPGAVPDPALAIQGAVAEEIRQVLALARPGR